MLLKRPRRLRKNSAVRSLVQEAVLSPADLIVPIFIVEGHDVVDKIPALPGIDRISVDQLLVFAEQLHSSGIPAIALFPVIPSHKKDPTGSMALDIAGLVPRAIRAVKSALPSLCVITDIALDPYTSHGHDGIVIHGDVHNDETIKVLEKMALVHAECGVDFVAPSDMMDGRVCAIRHALDLQGFNQTGILAYTAKYASSLYAPFRNALSSSLEFGDKKSYQMNPANSREALLEAQLDAEEGADILMIKPALFYLDIIAKVRGFSTLPVCAYHVSGEYAMVMAAAEKGWLDPDAVFYEALLSIKRAGADCMFSYAAPRLLPYMKRGSAFLTPGA